MEILNIYLICYENKIGKLILFFLLILFGTFLETIGIGLLIPLLSLMVNEMSIIENQIRGFFNGYPIKPQNRFVALNENIADILRSKKSK